MEAERVIDRLAHDPRPPGMIAMKGRGRGLSRVHVGKDYRLIYEIDSRARLVMVFEIAHRSKVYRDY